MQILRKYGGLAALVATATLSLGVSAKPTSEALVYLERAATAQEIQQLEKQYQVDLQHNSLFSTDGRLFRFRYQGESLATLTADPLIQFAEPNYTYQALGFPNDPLYGQQWNLKMIGMEKAWPQATGKGVVVAVIDTGIDRSLPDLQQTKFIRGYDFVNDDDDATDDQGHGSHVAGTIAQSTNNGEGVAGIAHQATLMPVKVLNRYGSGSLIDVAEGIRFAADNGAKVINLSLGGGGDSVLLRLAVDYATLKGATVVCAAGNSQEPTSGYPALYGNCLSVAAVGPTGQAAFYSNYGRGVDLAAPGGDKQQDGEAGGVLQNTISPGEGSVYASYQGTSMAAPHVAGVAALLYEKGLTSPQEVRKTLLSAARPQGDDVANRYGAGVLQADQALSVLQTPYLFWRGGFSWLLPLVTILVGGFLWSLITWGTASRRMDGLAYGLGFTVFGLGIFPLEAVGTLWGIEGLLALVATPLPLWDRQLFEGFFNPVLHTVLLPGFLTVLLLANRSGRSWALGACLGTAALLALHGTVFYEPLLWFSDELWARGFLVVNSLLCLGLAALTYRTGEPQ